MADNLSERQTRILDYIRYVTKVRNYPPSVREIGEAVGLSSSSTVHNHLNQLERKGLIKRDPSKSRTVQLTSDIEADQERRNAISVPIVGHVAAGSPILAEQNIEDHVLLSADLAKEGYFLLRVTPDVREQTLAMAHVKPTDFAGRRMSGFVVVEPEGFRTEAGLAKWVQRGIENALAMKGDKPPRRTTARKASTRKPLAKSARRR